MYSYFLTVIPVGLPINIALAIVLIGVGYGMLTLKLQRKLSNPAKTKEIQTKINALTKEMNAMAKRNEDISAKQAELMPLISESMRSQMKSMFVILPIFFIIYYLAIPAVFAGYAGDYVNVIVPLSYQSLFIVSAIVFSLILSAMILIRDKMATQKLQKLAKAQEQPDTNNAK